MTTLSSFLLSNWITILVGLPIDEAVICIHFKAEGSSGGRQTSVLQCSDDAHPMDIGVEFGITRCIARLTCRIYPSFRCKILVCLCVIYTISVHPNLLARVYAGSLAKLVGITLFMWRDGNLYFPCNIKYCFKKSFREVVLPSNFFSHYLQVMGYRIVYRAIKNMDLGEAWFESLQRCEWGWVVLGEWLENDLNGCFPNAEQCESLCRYPWFVIYL